MKTSVSNFDQLPDSALITQRTVGELFGGLSHSTVWRWIKDGRLPQPQRIGNRPFWPVGVIRSLLNPNSN
jgi:predicted DNA-binding transcriptional regulator AlpA